MARVLHLALTTGNSSYDGYSSFALVGRAELWQQSYFWEQ